MEGSIEYSDYLDFYDRGPFAPHVIEARTVGSIPVKLAKLRLPIGEFSDPPLSDIALIFGNGRPFRTQVRGDAIKWAGRFGPGQILVPPPLTTTDYLDDDPVDIMVMSASVDGLNKLTSDTGVNLSNLRRVHERPFKEPLIVQLAQRVWRDTVLGSPNGTLFVDSAMLTIAACLASFDGAKGLEIGPVRGGLAPFRLRRVADLVDAHLQDELSIADLAGAAGLSVFHFARAFRQETGKRPHEWVLDRRIERAKSLLGTSDYPISSIAASCGFRSRAGFNTAFKRIAGLTPTEWRNSM